MVNPQVRYACISPVLNLSVTTKSDSEEDFMDQPPIEIGNLCARIGDSEPGKLRLVQVSIWMTGPFDWGSILECLRLDFEQNSGHSGSMTGGEMK